MKKRAIVVFDGEVAYIPPIITLMRILSDIGENPVLVTNNHFTNPDYLSGMPFDVSFVNIPTYIVSFKKHPIKRIITFLLRYRHFIERRNAFWKVIRGLDCGDSTIWSLNTPTLEILGDEINVYGKKHIHLCYELEDDLLKKDKWFTPQKMFETATIVQCEQNRADIMAALYNLKRRPFVLPNKPYGLSENENFVDLDEKIGSILNGWKDKFVFLYQGMLGADRIGLIKVLEWLCKNFPNDVVALQTHIKGFSYDELLKYKNFCIVPSLRAPYHLMVTKHASVGIAYYVTNRGICSPLNAIYCAPNKIYEYACFGVPTLGNDVPGLRYAVEYNNAGVCFKELNESMVVEAANRIKENYDAFSIGAKNMFKNVDLHRLIREIVVSANGK